MAESGSTVRIRAVFLHQLRSVLRDRRTVMVAFVVPLVVLPAMILISGWVTGVREERRESVEIEYAVTGPAPERTRNIVRMAGQWTADTDTVTSLAIREETADSPLSALAAGEVHLVIRAVRGFKAHDNQGDPAKPPLFRIYYRSDSDESGWAMEGLSSALRGLRTDRRTDLLLAAEAVASPDSFMAVSAIDVAPEGRSAGYSIGRLATLFALFFVLAGGSVVAMDLVAGERERGSLETLLTTAITRRELALAKQLVVLAVAVAICLLQALNLYLYTSLGLLDSPLADAAVPAETVLTVLALLLPLAFLASGVLLLISSRARTYKEAQILLFPVMLLGAVPAAAPLLPGVNLESVAVAVPVANIALAVRDVLTGTASAVWVAASWLVTATAGAAASLGAARLMGSSVTPEAEVLPTSPLQLRLRLFSKAAPRIFLPMFALILLSSSIFADRLGVQVIVNTLLILLGGSLLLLRRYRLPVLPVLRVREPNPAIWPLLAAAVPAGLVLSAHVYRLSAALFPASARMMEEMYARGIGIDAPTWQLLLLGALLPAVCEEAAFRGVLQGSVTRTLGRTPAVILSALVFGLFHMAPVRFLPTAFLGVLLALSVTLTGSLLPAVIWHALNNALALLSSGTWLDTASPGPLLTGGAAAVIAGALFVMWRTGEAPSGPAALDSKPAGDG
jgi:ABC-type Na+ efflux pump permease subunit/membrane protease YdiL (CAAX protease family)